ncbi:MAG TPA: SPOR domain-containing protein [Bacteroidales bacterium]|nr:SPOR domain-containing protein [Bacteroidales bacterium]
MKILTYLIIGSFVLLSSCAGVNKRLRKSSKSDTDKVTSTTTMKTTLAPAGPIREVEEKLVPTDEKAPDPSRYFVIIGSFRNPDNAKKYQSQIRNDGFTPEVLKNEAGLYRVSVLATDDVTIARNEVRRIWANFTKYSDTWLLIQKL